MHQVTSSQILDSIHLSVQQKYTYTETDEQRHFFSKWW